MITKELSLGKSLDLLHELLENRQKFGMQFMDNWTLVNQTLKQNNFELVKFEMEEEFMIHFFGSETKNTWNTIYQLQSESKQLTSELASFKKIEIDFSKAVSEHDQLQAQKNIALSKHISQIRDQQLQLKQSLRAQNKYYFINLNRYFVFNTKVFYLD